MATAAQILNVVVDIIFGAPPQRGANFGVGALLRKGISLNGDRFRDYTSEAALRADRDAGYLDAYTYQTGVYVLQQRPRVSKFRAIRVDALPSAETYDAVLSAFLGTEEGAETFAYFLDTELLTDISPCVTVLAAHPKLKMLGFTTDDAAPATTYATLMASNLLCIDYDAADLANYNKGMVGVMSRLAYDQDRYTPSGTGRVAGIANSSTSITQAALDALVADNINVYAPRSPAAVYRYAGRMASGLPMTCYVSAAWLQARCDEALSRLVVEADDRGEIIPLNSEGQALAVAEVEAVFDRAVSLRKVAAGQYNVEAPALTPTNLADQELPIEAEATLTTPTAKVSLAVTVSQTNINEE